VPLGFGAATAVVARWQLKRFIRGKTLWLSVLVLVLPVLPTLFSRRGIVDGFESMPFALAIIAALLSAGAIGDEIDDQTSSYVFTRPLPRGAVLLGKYLISTLLLALFGCATGALILSMVGEQSGTTWAAGLSGIAIGAAALCATAIAWGTLIPRRNIAAAIGYLLALDFPIGFLPFSLRTLSLSFHMRQVMVSENWNSLVWLVGLGAVWMAITQYRLRRL
jgi:ABC-type transport system involved in multi-copper enzyme maturation permease subunit